MRESYGVLESDFCGVVVQSWWVLYGFPNEKWEKPMPCCMCEKYKWKDPQPVVYTDPDDGKGYCLFHAPAEHKGVSVDEFNNQIFNTIQLSINGEGRVKECYLSGVVFPGKIKFDAYDSSNPLQAISFLGAEFKASASFQGVKFTSVAVFDGTVFRSDVNFSMAKFDEDVWFHNTSFVGESKFVKTKFKRCSFLEVLGNGKMIFDACSVDPYFFTTFTSMSVGRCQFLFTDMGRIQFRNCEWPKYRGVYCQEGEPNSIYNRAALNNILSFYQQMKAKYKAENNEYEASKWHIAEKEAQLKLLGQSEGAKFNWFMLWLYKAVSGFGENPRRAFGVLLGLLFLPLLVLLVAAGMDVQINFAWWTFHSAPAKDLVGEWLKYIPLTRAMADEPSSGWRALMFLWQLLITLQAALFAFALRNNFRR